MQGLLHTITRMADSSTPFTIRIHQQRVLLPQFGRVSTRSHVNIVMSHDWPNGIQKFGNVDQLLREKPGFKPSLERNDLGSPPLWEVLLKLEPIYWMAAHMHVKFEAAVPHHKSPQHKSTKFLALHQTQPGQQYLEVSHSARG